MSERLAEQLALLPDYLSHHLALSLAALALGIIICLPLAAVVTRVKTLQWPTLGFASVMQTIPGIALLALMVPLLSQIGFVPALIALILYSMLPILRNTVTGILEVDPAAREAAVALGMTSAQRLFKVEAPLALPMIVAGIRTASVWVIGAATLSTPVGATSLGNYIFGGLQTQNYTAVTVGCVSAAGLAILLDQLIRLIESALKKRSKAQAFTALGALSVILAVGLSPMISGATNKTQKKVVIGAKTFTEQYILADALAILLRDAGYETEVRSSMGSTVVFDALVAGEVDVYVDYSGTIWANHMLREDNPGADSVLKEMSVWLKETHRVVCPGALGFENTYALAVRGEDAVKLQLETVTDLAPYSSGFVMGSDYEFYSRPEWGALTSQYDLRFAKLVSMDHSLMYLAVAEKEVDVIAAYSTDGHIPAYGLKVLADPKGALPPYDAVLLVSPEASQDGELMRTLEALVGSIDNEVMQRANKAVDLDKKPVSSAARDLLEQIHLAR